MKTVEQLAGAVALLVALADVFLTILYARMYWRGRHRAALARLRSAGIATVADEERCFDVPVTLVEKRT